MAAKGLTFGLFRRRGRFFERLLLIPRALLPLFLPLRFADGMYERVCFANANVSVLKPLCLFFNLARNFLEEFRQVCSIRVDLIQKLILAGEQFVLDVVARGTRNQFWIV